jgi:hypothetical protein
MEMPKVVRCDVNDCAYNTNNCCHALAITVGDEAHPRCDTFCHSMMKGGDSGAIAGVGACKVYECSYNSGLECNSPEICVGYKGQEADCLTFKSR